MADKNKLKSLKDKLNYSASPKFLCMDNKKPETDGPARAPKQPTTPPRKSDNDNAPKKVQPKQTYLTRQEAAQLEMQQRQQAAAQAAAKKADALRKQVKPSVEKTRMGDDILVRLEITAEKEIETKFDFYTQTVSTQTTYYMGDKKQIQPGAAVPFSKYAAHHVLSRIRQDLIDMGGKPAPINPEDGKPKASKKVPMGFHIPQPKK